MPAPVPSPVDPSQPITKTDLDALATYANDKSIIAGKNGTAHSFSSSGGWKTSLDRLFQNALNFDSSNTDYSATFYVGELTGKFVPPHELLISRKVPFFSGPNFCSRTGSIGINGGFFPASKRNSGDSFSAFRYVCEGAVNGTGTVRVYGDAFSGVDDSTLSMNARMSKGISYVFCEPDDDGTPARSVTTIVGLDSNGSPPGIGCDESSDLRATVNTMASFDTLTWSFDVQVPADAVCRGMIALPSAPSNSFKAASGVVPSYSKIGDLASECSLVTHPSTGDRQYLKFEFVWGDRSKFNLGVQLNNYDPVSGSATECHFTQPNIVICNFSILSNNVSFVEWKFTRTAPDEESRNWIHPTKRVFEIEIPDCWIMNSVDTIDVNVDNRERRMWLSGSSPNQVYNFYSGNYARIWHSASSAIGSDGLFVGTTLPLSTIQTNPIKLGGSGSAFNRDASGAAPRTPTFRVRGVTPAIDYVNPSWPIVKIGSANAADSVLVARGACVFKVNIERLPVDPGDGIFRIPETMPAETVEIGFMRNGVFQGLEFSTGVYSTVLPEDSFSIELSVEWFMYSSVNLVYRTASENSMLITANVISATYALAITSPRGIKLPICTDHYNQILDGLNKIS